MSRSDNTGNTDDAENTGPNPNLDPDPSGTSADADLDAGGGVIPGHTPPESNSATASPAHPPPRRPSRNILTFTLLGLLVAALVFIFVAYAVGLL